MRREYKRFLKAATPKTVRGNMEMKNVWWHKFLTKESLVMALLGFILGAWTVAYHLNPSLPSPEPPPVDDETQCHDMYFPKTFQFRALTCPSKHHAVHAFGGDVLCECRR